jgi:hypothetical protein
MTDGECRWDGFFHKTAETSVSILSGKHGETSKLYPKAPTRGIRDPHRLVDRREALMQLSGNRGRTAA